MSIDSQLPKISVVTPVLNGAASLRNTILSILEQEYPNLEYIVVDGGSTDGSLEIIQEYRGQIACVLQGKDRTMYDAVAKGFDQATGEIFTWLNSDDRFMPGVLWRIGRLMLEHPDWQVIYGDDAVSKQNWLVANRPQRPIGLPELLQGHVIPQASTFFRRTAYLEVGGLERVNLKLAADFQLWTRFAARYELHFLPEQLSVFGIRPRQLSGDWTAYSKEMRACIEGAYPYLPPRFWLRTMIPRWRRRRARAAIRRAHFYPLRDENRNWPTVTPAPRQSLATCRCPICMEYPPRLLFSSPDLQSGDSTAWQMYYCENCQVAFRFPNAPSDLLRHLRESKANPLPNQRPLDTFSPYPTYNPLASPHYAAVAPLYHERAHAEFPVIDAPRSASVLLIDAPGSGSRQRLDELGFQNVQQEFIDEVNSSGPNVDVIILNQSLQYSPDPIGLLSSLRPRLNAGGCVYLSIPNLDSIFLRSFGPNWSQWRIPHHAVLMGRYGLQSLAQKSQYRIARLRCTIPVDWLCTSQQIATHGYAVSAPAQPAPSSPSHLRNARGAAMIASLLHNRRLRGDCLHACLQPA